MGQIIDLRVFRDAGYRESAERIAESVEGLTDVVSDLVALRSQGESAEAAVEALLELPAVRTTRLSWQLLEALMEGDGLDPRATFAKVLGPWLLPRARLALLGAAA